MKYKGNLGIINFLHVVNENGFTLTCTNCAAHNGECNELAKAGRCSCYNKHKEFRKLLEEIESLVKTINEIDKAGNFNEETVEKYNKAVERLYELGISLEDDNNEEV